MPSCERHCTLPAFIIYIIQYTYLFILFVHVKPFLLSSQYESFLFLPQLGPLKGGGKCFLIRGLQVYLMIIRRINRTSPNK